MHDDEGVIVISCTVQDACQLDPGQATMPESGGNLPAIVSQGTVGFSSTSF